MITYSPLGINIPSFTATASSSYGFSFIDSASLAVSFLPAPSSGLMLAQGTGERGQTSKPDNPKKGARPVVKNGKVTGWTVQDNQTGMRIPKSLDWGRTNGLNDLDPKWVTMGAAAGAGAMTIWEILEGLSVLNEVTP